MPDQLEPEIPVAERLRFAPGESPYSGVREALATIRRGMSQLDKYLGAIERDVEVFEREFQASRGAVERPTRRPDPEPDTVPAAPEDHRPGKSWRNR
jgi:hypothetical protein